MTPLPPVTHEEARSHGLSDAEFERAREILGRVPNIVELGIFSVLWSEHCSYKSSRLHLKKFPTQAPWVLQGPGENAGIVDIGEGWAAAFKMESHNHPSFIEPFQGAATGVGGILRDIFTMGARCIACMDSLRFGDVDAPRMTYLVDGVVGGIASYGNCMGIPTVGGETTFFPAYDKNNLVNAFALGIVRHDRIFRGYASGPGNPVIYVGSKTGRDGIHGATMASEVFDKDSEAKRPNVQVGDPFTEKLLMEACLELMQKNDIVGIQDMGAAGLTSSSFEMCGRSGTGMEIDLDAVPLREEGMTPYEIMLSESQERMLLVAKAGRESAVIDTFARWGLEGVIIGRVTGDGIVRATWRGEEVLAIPAEPLSSASPLYDRPSRRPAYLDDVTIEEDLTLPDPPDWERALLDFAAHPNLCSKRWIWRQYDHSVRINTLLGPGLGAAILRVKGTERALALTSDVNPLYTYLDPEEGAVHAVAEAAINIACTGAKPLGITDCLNYGNPEDPEIMWQFIHGVEGIARACRALDIPVVSGNVSFYNDTEGTPIWPTPTVAMVGVTRDLDHLPARQLPPETALFLLDAGEVRLGGSLYAFTQGHLKGRIPRVDLDLVRREIAFLQEAYHQDLLYLAHDLSQGGLAGALFEIFSVYGTGCNLTLPGDSSALTLFGEGCGRVLLLPRDETALTALAGREEFTLKKLGILGGDRVVVEALGVDIALNDLVRASEEALPNIMGG